MSHKWAPPGYASRSELVKDIQVAKSNKPLARGALENCKAEDTVGVGKGMESRRNIAMLDETESKIKVTEGDGTRA